ncbi:uncharacterized protein LOC131684007 [Topomyia yanbarensis]|uniref:uncharacterized protein LOC131684007 n=1 Tax=Topomyia yanbarensis TaxID=2498891 RepID=UPI00273B8CEF|nr:uncharacterized protein LOC131684007 [Topomyia yanbarensis]XP_058822450.1 uncharacterized protein LOC131684007 [Topomyia yanbarensis]
MQFVQMKMIPSNLTIPTYCEHYKPLMVEEITLVQHPTMMHYGKCAVIGYRKGNSTSLDSLRVPGLPEDLQLPDGTCQLELSFDNYYGPLPTDCSVRLYGSLKLRGPIGTSMNCSKDLICFLRQLHTDLERQGTTDSASVERRWQEEFDAMADSYLPVLDIEGCERVAQAKELIACDLRLRRINLRLEPAIQKIQMELS